MALDPASLTSAMWNDLGKLLTSMWLMVLFVVFFAANMLLGHNMIPSLIASQHLSGSWQKARVIFYLTGFVSLVFGMFFLSRAIRLASVLEEFWPNYWI